MAMRSHISIRICYILYGSSLGKLSSCVVRYGCASSGSCHLGAALSRATYRGMRLDGNKRVRPQDLRQGGVWALPGGPLLHYFHITLRKVCDSIAVALRGLAHA